MKIKKGICIAFAAALLAAFPLYAQQPVKMMSFPIPLMVETPTSGVFVELTLAVAKRAGVPVTIEIMPTVRAIATFDNQGADGFFPALDVTMPAAIAKSTPIYMKIDFVFSLKGSALKTLKDLEGKRVGLTRGYPYAKELTENPKILITWVDDDLTNMKLLGAGRIDAFVVEEKSGQKALAQSGLAGIEYDPKKPLSSMAVYYAFQATEQGRQLAAKFSAALQAMQADGSFGAIMSKAN